MAITTIPEVREEIQENINTNNNRAITGQVLQTTLVDMLDTVDDVKANTTGYYEGMSVGLADNLISPDTENDSASWLYRSTAGDKDVSSGFATIEGMKGNTIVWNQLVQNGDFSDGTNNWAVGSGATISANNNVLEVTITTDSSSHYIFPTLSLVQNHKYLISFDFWSDALGYSGNLIGACTFGGNELTSEIKDVGTNLNTWYSYKAIKTSTASYTYSFALSGWSGESTNKFKNVQVIDLTLMFGAGNEPSTVEEFERLFPESYYAYDEGSLLSFNPTDIQTTGFNQYDNSKQTENVHVLADNKYRIKGTYTGLTYSDGSDVTITSDGYFTSDRVDRLTLTGGNNVDTCVHLSWSGYRDGDDDYEKYWSVNTDLSWINKITYQGNPLFPNGLCRAGEAYDEISGGKAIKRVGSVDLGSLTWTKGVYEGVAYYVSYDLQSLVKTPQSNNVAVTYLICTKYGNHTIHWGGLGASTSSYDKSMCISTIGIFGIQDSAYTDYTSATFKAAMSGVMLYYELATPIVVDLPEGINLNYRMDDFGTEEFINTTTASDVPGLCKPTLVDIGYQTNLRDKIRRLDDNYVSFTVDQTNTASEEEKFQARKNIGLSGEYAQVSGYYPGLEAGVADNLKPISTDVVSDLSSGFIGRTTGGSTTIPDVGKSQIMKINGRWDNTAKTCFNPVGGFLSLGGNWYRPDYVIENATINTSGAIVSGTGYVAIVPCIMSEYGSGNNNGMKVESEAYARSAVYALSGGYPTIGSTGTIPSVNNTYGSLNITVEVGYLGVAVTSLEGLYIHPVWSGYKNGVYVEPNESVGGIPTCEWGLSDMDYAYLNTEDRGIYLHRGSNKVALSGLVWSSTVNEETYTWLCELPEDAKSGGVFHTDYTANTFSLSGKTISFASTSITNNSELMSSLGNSFILYELAEGVETVSSDSMIFGNSDFGGEFFLASSEEGSYTLSALKCGDSFSIHYGVDYLGWLRDDHKAIEKDEKVTARALDDIDRRVSEIEKGLSDGFLYIKTGRLVVDGMMSALLRNAGGFMLITTAAPNAANVPDGWDVDLYGKWNGTPAYNGQFLIDKKSKAVYIGIIDDTGTSVTSVWAKITA